jgi:uncharacterized membrane protein HdeD (DUF308 family)
MASPDESTSHPSQPEHAARRPYGIASLVAGILAFLAATIAAYARHMHEARNELFLLDWMERIRITSSMTAAKSELKAYSAYVWTEPHLIAWFQGLALVLGIATVAAAIASDRRKEGTLYLAGGTILAGLACALAWPKAALALLIAPALMVLIARRLSA